MATPSNLLPISGKGYPVASLKHKISENTLGVCPQQKVTGLALLLMAVKDDKPHGHGAVPLKPKHSGRIANIHPLKKVAFLAPLVIIFLLMPAWLLMTTKDGGQVVPLKHEHSDEFLGIHPPNKIAHIGIQEIAIADPMPTHPIQCCTVENAPGDPFLQNQICSMWFLPNELLITIATHLPQASLWALTQIVVSWRPFQSGASSSNHYKDHVGAKASTAMMSNKPMAYHEQAFSQAAFPVQLCLVAASLTP
ncbi:hypothetical protein EDC04DRAFT_2606044 [Pisolithus marmoratus]|nr:hypothetical protein EDC04DRAFT_2606044 [Pisolithus marmoratus]